MSKLLEKGVIEPCVPETGEFISTIFLRPKKDGSHRMILNLKKLNSFVEYHHFKMDTLTTAIIMMRPGCYMASVDLKDAYYTVPIAPQHQKFLKFFWRGRMWKFTGLPNDLTCAPRVFTKLLKPLFATLRKLGHLCFGYIDDTRSTAVNEQIVHLYDRSLKICCITNIAEIIISRYGAKSNSILVDVMEYDMRSTRTSIVKRWEVADLAFFVLLKPLSV